MEQEYTEDGEGGALRLPARVFPGAISQHEAAKAGQEVDEMFLQFKRANRLRSKKDMERIERL